MKKILLILIITIAVIVKLELKEINADSTATNMGFTVPTDWGIYKDTHTNSEYIYKEYNGIVYIVAETEVQSAVYELNSDDNFIAVIYETTLDPWDVNVRINFWLSRLYKHESRQITAFSDVDSSYYPVYQVVYTSGIGIYPDVEYSSTNYY